MTPLASCQQSTRLYRNSFQRGTSTANGAAHRTAIAGGGSVGSSRGRRFRAAAGEHFSDATAPHLHHYEIEGSERQAISRAGNLPDPCRHYSKVVVTAGSDEKCAECLSLGADVAINYRSQDFVEELKTRSIAPDVILDMVGGDYIARNLRCVAMNGRIVNIAFQKGAKVEVDLLPVMLKRLTLTGSTLRPRSVAEKADIAGSLEAKVWPLFAAGKCKPVIFKTFPLAEASEAHRLMESSQHVGKIILTV